MKSVALKFGVLALLTTCLVSVADAQRGSRRRPPAGNTTTPANPNVQQQNNNNQQPSGYNPYGNIPIVVDSTSMNDTAVRKSLRPDNAFDKSSLTARTPLDYEHLR